MYSERSVKEWNASTCVSAITDAVKCEHERSIHLFIDSLLNEQDAAKAYRCSSGDMFNRGMCLNCHKSRCNTVGYDISKVRKARNVQMYTKTRASMPFRGVCSTDSSVCASFFLTHPDLENQTNDAEFLACLPVYHYQLKIHFSSKVKRSEMEPSLTVSLYGTKGDAENLELKLYVLDLKSFIKENCCTLTCILQVI